MVSSVNIHMPRCLGYKKYLKKTIGKVRRMPQWINDWADDKKNESYCFKLCEADDNEDQSI